MEFVNLAKIAITVQKIVAHALLVPMNVHLLEQKDVQVETDYKNVRIVMEMDV